MVVLYYSLEPQEFFGGIQVHQRTASKGGRPVGGQGAEPPEAGEDFNFLKINKNFTMLAKIVNFW